MSGEYVPDFNRVMDGVREYEEGYPVLLCRHGKTGRMVIRAKNEGGCNHTDVDLWDLIEWLRSGTRDVGLPEPLGFPDGFVE